jgi:hypothetical protein
MLSDSLLSSPKLIVAAARAPLMVEIIAMLASPPYIITRDAAQICL